MTSHTLLVKNMVCHRCVLTVEDILNKAAIPFLKVVFGEIHLTDELSPEQRANLSAKLKNIGFEIADINKTVGNVCRCFIKIGRVNTGYRTV